MKTVELGSLCRPRQWPVISGKEMLEAGNPVFGANGQIGYTNRVTHERETIAVGCRGSCGHVHLVPAGSYINGNAMALDDLDEGRADRRYVYRWLQRRGFSDVVTGTSQPQIIQSNIRRVDVPLPSLPDQRRIAAILDQADALRRLRRQSLIRADDLGGSIFSNMFEDVSIFDTIPLADVVANGDSLNYGVVQPGPDVEEGVPLIRVGDMLQPNLNIKQLKIISVDVERDYKRSRLNGREVLIACVGSIGAIALATEAVKGANIARAVARVPLNEDICSREFIAEQLKSKAVQNYFRRETRTVSQPTLNIKQIKETRIFLPSADRQREFVDRLAMAKAMINGITRACTTADSIFTSLQHRAFRGEL